jgi:hypothetical protein
MPEPYEADLYSLGQVGILASPRVLSLLLQTMPTRVA